MAEGKPGAKYTAYVKLHMVFILLKGSHDFSERIA